MYTVTRQEQWPEGNLVVEVSMGGIDYTNPDALVARYPGEFEEFSDPREAVETAISIAKQWQKDESDKKIEVAAGYTGGYTMPFEPQKMDELRKWALSEYKELPKCAWCGGIISDESEAFYLETDEGPFCSEHCAERAYEKVVEEAEL